MLRRYKNALFQELLKSGFDPSLFETEANDDDQHHPAFEIRLKDTELSFVTRNPIGHFDQFDYQFVEFAAGYPWTEVRPAEGYIEFGKVLEVFREWIATDVDAYLQDAALPDLWAQVNQARAMLNQAAQPDVAEEFSADERTQVRIAVQQFQLLVIKEFAPSPDEQAVVVQQLERLADAVERLNKFDWQGVALNTLISISVTLSLDTEKGRILYGLFQQALSYALHLLK
jgi:hypothetical protein